MVAAAALLLAVGCSDDDDGGIDLGAPGEDSGGSGDGEATSGFSPEVEEEFMASCTAQPGAAEDDCQCSFDAIAQSTSLEEYLAYEEALREDQSAAPPAWFTEAVAGCFG